MLTALLMAILPASTAGASIYTQVLHVYQLEGSVPPCMFSSAQLSKALKGIDTYGQQYFADFSDAVQAALSARATGACSPGGLRALLTERGGRTGTAPPLPASLTAPTNAGLPAAIVVMAVLAAAAGIALAIGAIARSRGWEPDWVVRWRHACAEAWYRIGAGWSDFGEWIRLRR